MEQSWRNHVFDRRYFFGRPLFAWRNANINEQKHAREHCTLIVARKRDHYDERYRCVLLTWRLNALRKFCYPLFYNEESINKADHRELIF